VPGLRGPALLLARSRNVLVVWAAVVAPVGFIMIRQATLYDGIRHTLFVVPMLALLGGWALIWLLRKLRRACGLIAMLAAACIISAIVNSVILHPLEYIATNAFAGGTAGSYGRFDLDYWAVSATEALRRLERRLDANGAFADNPPSLLMCIPWREHMVRPMLNKNWQMELDAKKADFVIETERWRCAADVAELILIDEVTRHERAFAWIHVNRGSRFIEAARP
jgi:hypothetical protein